MEQTLSQFSQADMLKAELAGGWTPKDVVAHIIAWEQVMLDWIDVALQGKTPVDLPQNEQQEAAINARIHADNQNRDLVGVLREFKTSHQQAIEKVEEMPEDALKQPAYPPWREHQTLMWIVSVNTWQHYHDHRLQLEEWRAREGGN